MTIRNDFLATTRIGAVVAAGIVSVAIASDASAHGGGMNHGSGVMPIHNTIRPIIAGPSGNNGTSKSQERSGQARTSSAVPAKASLRIAALPATDQKALTQKTASMPSTQALATGTASTKPAPATNQPDHNGVSTTAAALTDPALAANGNIRRASWWDSGKCVNNQPCHYPAPGGNDRDIAAVKWLGKEIGKGVAWYATDVADGGVTLGRAGYKIVSPIGNGIETGAKAFGSGVGTGANAVADTAVWLYKGNAASFRDWGDVIGTGTSKAGSGISTAAHAVADVSKAAESKAVSAVKSVGHFIGGLF